MAAATEGTGAGALRTYKAMVEEEPSLGERSPSVVARWAGGDASNIECGGMAISLGGEERLPPMQAVLAALAACDVDVVATHAALLGLDLEGIVVEATGHFDIRSYLGVEGAPRPGFDAISYVVHVAAPEATPGQIRYLRQRCEQSSPVGDSLTRTIPLQLRFETNNTTPQGEPAP
jgi:uncharacterized OsmC-like protein